MKRSPAGQRWWTRTKGGRFRLPKYRILAIAQNHRKLVSHEIDMSTFDCCTSRSRSGVRALQATRCVPFDCICLRHVGYVASPCNSEWLTIQGCVHGSINRQAHTRGPKVDACSTPGTDGNGRWNIVITGGTKTEFARRPRAIIKPTEEVYSIAMYSRSSLFVAPMVWMQTILN